MKNRYFVFGLSIVLALALAVPALGGPTNPVASLSASAKSIANKALKKAKKAQKTAEAAQSSANNAQSTADSANSAASKAQTTANGASAAAAKAQSTADGANTAAGKAQSTADSANTAAGKAQIAADKAQTTANEAKSLAEGSFSETDFESGTTVSGEGEDAIAAAGCQAGFEPTGGGFVLAGTDSRKVRVDLSSQYLNGWIVSADNISGHTGESWELSAAVTCIG
jgi:uncharacterized phage infection (PIP) family protein YhgE